MNKPRAKGTKFEREVCQWLQVLDPTVDRRPLYGKVRHGDTTVIRFDRCTLATSVKAHKRLRLFAWLKELDEIWKADKATSGMLIVRLHGVGDPLDQAVVFSVREFLKIMSRYRYRKEGGYGPTHQVGGPEAAQVADILPALS